MPPRRNGTARRTYIQQLQAIRDKIEELLQRHAEFCDISGEDNVLLKMSIDESRRLERLVLEDLTVEAL